MNPAPVLSVVVPALDEGDRIGAAVSQILAAMDAAGLAVEVVVVDDGSTDATCDEAAAAGARALRLERNVGKGAAVRAGVLAAVGERIAFLDADLAYPPDQLVALVAALDAGADVVVGSRHHPDSLDQAGTSPTRAVGNRVFSAFARIALGIDQDDPQCGFKAFRREAARVLFRESRVDGFAFDAEVLFLASKLGYRVVEVPVRLVATTGSTVRLGHDALGMAVDLLRVRARGRSL